PELGVESRKELGGKPETPGQLGAFGALKPLKCWLFIVCARPVTLARGWGARHIGRSKSARFCYTWVITLHFSLTRKSAVAYDFCTSISSLTSRMRPPSV